MSGGEAFEKAEDEDFAVGVGEAIECGGDAGLEFGTYEPAVGGEVGGGEMLDKEGRGIGWDRFGFAENAASTGLDVLCS